MDVPEKDIDIHLFTGPTNSDVGDEFLQPNSVRKMLNARRTTLGDKGLVTNVLGNLLIQAGYATGNNLGIGWKENKQDRELYYFNYNDQGYHGIYCFNLLTGAVTPIIQNLVETNNVDILKFDPNFRINHIDVAYVQNQVTGKRNILLYWVDALNKGRKTNKDKCVDKSDTGYGTVISEDFITAYKQTAVYAPTLSYFTDGSRTSNYMYGLQFKAGVRFYYDDNEVSNWSDWSSVPFPPNEGYNGPTALSFANNGIKINVETGSKLVVKIEIAVLISSTTPETTLPWVGVVVLNKAELNISDYAKYDFLFYNDGSYLSLDQKKVTRQFSFMPRVPKIQSLVKVALIYGNFDEGFPSVPVNVSTSLSFKPFFLPEDTVSQFNNPFFTAVEVSKSTHKHWFDSWVTQVFHFVVGGDVIKGNVFTLVAQDWQNLFGFSHTATIADSSTTIASAIKQFLRNMDSVRIDNPIQNEITNMSGDVSWDFTIQAHEGKSGYGFRANTVNPVNYITLLNDGLSVNTKKMGSTEKYAIVYVDDDGRESLGYTSDDCLVNIAFETEILLGQTTPLGLQQPIVTLSIMHSPPSWARYWKLVRTAGPDTFIQLLIQQVNNVVVANEDTYMDLIVGSLFTYQKVHPNTILAYQFVRGDRLRLVKNEITGELYSPMFETEILDYTIDEEEFIDANITCDGTNNVSPDKPVDPNYIGKYIVINDNQRLIVGASGGKYQLDFPINPNPNYSTAATATTVYPNYKFKDTRGIIRIKIPPASYNVVAMSKIEVFRPQHNISNQDYQNFFDVQMKFEVLNWGTPNAAHAGNIQNQDPVNPVTTPAVIQVTKGDAYVRYRAMPSNNQHPNPQTIIDQVCDPNWSDFYNSNMYDLGRIYPQDRGQGQVTFDSRIRFSNDYIQNTQVNGLNDFDELDYKDYNDQYGGFTLSRFRQGVLFLFKRLKNTWTHVFGNIITDNSGKELLTVTNKLLNELQYSVYEGGIGENGEGYVEHGDYQFIPSADSGTFIRLAQDGSIPISSIYFYDKRAIELLNNVLTYKLNVPGGYDYINGEVIWTVPDAIKYIFNNKFVQGDWQTFIAAYPDDTVWVITQQPANSVATIVGDHIEITGTNTPGNDFFKFRGNLSGGGNTPVINFCFEVTAVPPKQRVTQWILQTSPNYCIQIGGLNNGQQGWAVLNEIYVDDSSFTGRNMPNVPSISPDAIVPNTAVITYNPNSVIAPSGGANGDIWYNLQANTLFKKVTGIWSLLTNTTPNADYVPTIKNLGACAIPMPVNTFDIFNHSSVKGIVLSSISIDTTNYPQSSTIPTTGDVTVGTGAGTGTSTLHINIANAYTPSSSALTAPGYGPIAGTWVGGPIQGYVEFLNVDMSTNHVFTIDIYP